MHMYARKYQIRFNPILEFVQFVMCMRVKYGIIRQLMHCNVLLLRKAIDLNGNVICSCE